MATDILEDFESVGSAGTTITTGNSDFDTVNGAPTVESASGAGEGSFYMEVAATSAIITGVVTFTARGQVYVEFYYRFASAPVANTYICNAQSGGTIMAQIRHNTDNTILTRNRTTANSNVHSALSPNTWYRFQWLIGVSAGANQQLDTFVGHSTTPFDTTGSQAYTAGNMDRIALGVVASATLTNNFDFFRTSNSEFFGPAVTDVPKAGSDSATQSEGTTVLQVQIPVVDSTNFTESLTETTTSDGTDDSTLTETITSLQRSSAVTDSSTLIDSSALAVGFIASDANSLSAEISAIAITASLSDTQTQTEVAPATLVASLSVVDSSTLSESITRQQQFALVDSATQSEGTTTHVANLSASDSFTLDESSGLNSGGILAASDTNTITEVASIAAASSVVDSSLLSDGATLIVQIPGSDSATQSETNTTLIQTFECVDAGIQSDASFLEASNAIVGTDSAVQNEGITALVVNIVSGDSAALSESTLHQVSALANDTGALLEQATRDQVNLTVGTDGSTLFLETALLVVIDEDQSEFTVMRLYYPDQNPITQITFTGS